jgi:hypothetical protein
VLSTVIGIVAVIGLLLPGFVIAEVAKSGRARAAESDLELTLRALFYALALHLCFVWWTKRLVDRIEHPRDWTRHLDVLIPYTGIVIIGAPVVLGVVLNLYLRHVESTAGRTSLFHTILGGRDARDPWDYLFQRLRTGAWLIVQLKGGDSANPRLLGGKLGKHSAAGQSPSEHSLYLQELWAVSDTFPRNLLLPIEPQRGVWIAAGQIDSIQVLNPPGASLQSESNGS